MAGGIEVDAEAITVRLAGLDVAAGRAEREHTRFDTESTSSTVRSMWSCCGRAPPGQVGGT
jgi:hypothetical protein